MYLYTENYSERGLRTWRAITEIITKSRPGIGTFYIPTRMTHGLPDSYREYQCLKGSYNEPE